MARLPNGTLADSGTVTVEIDGTGAGSAEVSFSADFVGTPTALLQAVQGDAGTWSITPSSNTLAAVAVTGSDLVSTSIELGWLAMEPR